MLDASASSIATGAAAARIAAHNFLFYCINSGTNTLYVLDASLSTLDTRAVPGGDSYLAVATDGTSVWVVAANNYYSYDASNLATENWNATSTGSGETSLVYKNSYLYSFGQRIWKVDPANGTEVWQSDIVGAPRNVKSRDVGSNFVMLGNVNVNFADNLYCINDSDGSTRWQDQWALIRAVIVTDDDRVFVCGRRMGP